MTKGGKLDDLNLTPDSSPFIDSVTREDSFDGGDDDDQPSIGIGVDGMEVVGRAMEVATPMGTRSLAKLSSVHYSKISRCQIALFKTFQLSCTS